MRRNAFVIGYIITKPFRSISQILGYCSNHMFLVSSVICLLCIWHLIKWIYVSCDCNSAITAVVMLVGLYIGILPLAVILMRYICIADLFLIRALCSFLLRMNNYFYEKMSEDYYHETSWSQSSGFQQKDSTDSNSQLKKAMELYGLDGHYTEKDLRRRRWALMKESHPDSGGNVSTAQEINSAFDILLKYVM